MALQEVADEYFRSINSTAKRLCEDMKEIKSNYEHLWDDFTESEKSEIINETIVKPEISIQYAKRGNVIKKEYQPLRKGDNNYSFKDEHSGPFQFRTVSQENLFMSGTNKISSRNNKAFKNKEKKVESTICEAKMDDLNAIPKTGLDLLDNW
nr:uncharacterized protein C1orf198 homolog isoform X1 [Onthophagus taurus]XP_022914153.1 uncharacterized protein C1orf198 homolog isoform X2 [Onthophagus taurus]